MYLFNRQKPEIYRNMHIGNNIGGEIKRKLPFFFGNNRIKELELRKEFLASNNLGHRERFITQVFLEHHFSLLESKLNISPGISWSNFSNEGNFFYPGIDVGFEFNESIKSTEILLKSTAFQLSRICIT